MSTITWIVIILIVISIGVTVSEVGIRFGLLNKQKGREQINTLQGFGPAPNWTQIGQTLSADQRQAVCGMAIVGETFAGI